ncbi:hypothetical protein PTSG_03455 [Salpingoeca rosetta]|uniref:Transcription initiation factor TFIID subunit 10 n=1 Tax=Salpingoeca rosetta (strain ATCC 50818 / BSB-021) TaxID=946362 RepID=F2U590_SALR5|nr:uncharacterized protein PTSG_03455 [Salpingoeca rosetta]EGD82806.1 hypothetical protein PTSG_03455 [Salpingoeca rosetta]|eukprot:XP_004996041.1 hypothetical protein PTSG_03455 [Salpingoeca rosetta]
MSDDTFVTEPELASLLSSIKHFVPLIPDEVVKQCLATAGVETDDENVIRLVSLAAQKFVSDVARDAYRYNQHRLNDAKKKTVVKDRENTLTMEDLSHALTDHNMTVVKPQYYL